MTKKLGTALLNGEVMYSVKCVWYKNDYHYAMVVGGRFGSQESILRYSKDLKELMTEMLDGFNQPKNVTA